MDRGRSRRTLVAAHRGWALLWPENSLGAFRNAIALGVDLLELDVHLSRDDELVVIHDPLLERTTTGTGPVGERTAAELRALRLRDPSGAVTEEAIPLLDEVLALAAPSLVGLLVEIKVDAQGAPYPGIEEKVLMALERRRVLERATLGAFQHDTLRRVLQLRPEVPVAGFASRPRLLQKRSTVAREIEALRKLGATYVGLRQELVTAKAVEQARAAGLRVGVWVVNEPEAMKRFVELGVGILITDRPDVARELLER